MSLFFSSDDILCFLSNIKLTPTKQVDNYCRRTILNECLFIYVWKTLFQRHCVCVCVNSCHMSTVIQLLVPQLHAPFIVTNTLYSML